MRKCIAVDIGGTRIKIAVVEEGQVRDFRMIPALSEGKLADRLPEIEKTVREITGGDYAAYEGIGVSLPCLVDPAKCRAAEIHGKFEDAPGLDLAVWSKSAFGIPLTVEQDSKAALLGERAFGAAKDCGNILMLIMGTGVGTAVMSDGRMLDGNNHCAGSLGSHIIIDAFHGRKCTCGGRGCLEAYTSGWALPGLLREHPAYKQSPFAEMEKPGFYELGEALKAGDGTARDTLNTVVTALRAGLISLIHAYNPEVVVLSGGPVHLGDVFLGPLLDGIENELWGTGHILRFEVAKDPEASVLLGMYAKVTEGKGEQDGI